MELIQNSDKGEIMQNRNMKFVIILQAGKESHEGMARAYHALLYCKDFVEKGYETKMIFDGAATAWVPELMKPEHKLHSLFKEIQAGGSLDAICDFCAGAFGVKDLVKECAIPMKSEFHGHPSIAKYVSEGYQLLIL